MVIAGDKESHMIGLYLYALQAAMVVVGVLLWSVVYWRDKNMARNARFVNKAVELRQRRKALSLAGFGLMMIGLMLFVDTYRSRHVDHPELRGRRIDPAEGRARRDA